MIDGGRGRAINRARGDGILCTRGGDGLALEGRKDNSFIPIGVKANGLYEWYEKGGVKDDPKVFSLSS